MSRSHFLKMFKCYNKLYIVLQQMSVPPAMRSVGRMVRCEEIVSLAMLC